MPVLSWLAVERRRALAFVVLKTGTIKAGKGSWALKPGDSRAHKVTGRLVFPPKGLTVAKVYRCVFTWSGQGQNRKVSPVLQLSPHGYAVVWGLGSDFKKHEFIGENRRIDSISCKFHRESQGQK